MKKYEIGAGGLPRFVLLALCLLLPGVAMAADLTAAPARAPNQSFLVYPNYNGSGGYWGVNAEAGVAQSKIGGTFAGSLVGGNLTAAGGTVGGTVGWMKGNGTSWFAVEASLEYMNITASQVGGSIASRWAAEQEIKLGGFQQPLSWLSNLGISFPSLPNIPAPPGFNIAANTSHPYILAGIREFGLTAAVAGSSARTTAAAPMVGAGVLNQLLDSNGKLSGAVLDVGAKVVFASHGFTFGAGGIGGSAKMGTEYLGYAKVLF